MPITRSKRAIGMDFITTLYIKIENGRQAYHTEIHGVANVFSTTIAIRGRQKHAAALPRRDVNADTDFHCNHAFLLTSYFITAS